MEGICSNTKMSSPSFGCSCFLFSTLRDKSNIRKVILALKKQVCLTGQAPYICVYECLKRATRLHNCSVASRKINNSWAFTVYNWNCWQKSPKSETTSQSGSEIKGGVCIWGENSLRLSYTATAVNNRLVYFIFFFPNTWMAIYSHLCIGIQ